VLLHKKQIAANEVQWNCSAKFWVMIMSINSTEKYSFAIDRQIAVFDLDLTESHRLFDCLECARPSH
jgi:hypothetical protein